MFGLWSTDEKKAEDEEEQSSSELVIGETINPHIAALLAKADSKRKDKNGNPVGFREQPSDYT